MKKALKYFAVLLLLALVVCQFIPRGRVHAPRAKPPSAHLSRLGDAKVEAILNRSCVDCHSSNAQLPWYGHVAPVSWWISSHVDRGIEKWDIAVWDVRPPLHGEAEDMCNSAYDKSMPLRSYTLMHRRAKLSQNDIDTLCGWADSLVTQGP